jgi:chromosome segregation ATPase
MNQADWTEQLLSELEDAASLAQRGATISDVLRDAKAAAERGAKAAKKADAEVRAKLQSAEERAARAFAERDAATARATVAEAARTVASDTLKDMEHQLATAEEALERTKKQAAQALGELDDAYEHEQDRVQAMRVALEEQKRALKKAEREAKLAAARAASTAADVNAVKREKSEVEIRLEEERMILEGCLLDANSERDALL